MADEYLRLYGLRAKTNRLMTLKTDLMKQLKNKYSTARYRKGVNNLYNNAFYAINSLTLQEDIENTSKKMNLPFG